ncbi:MAG TPA: metal-dependent hydrolase [Candidatus Acidoferrales bacterium]|nr:metal-dependent hydrolase [Candidatus Acidoferrales bacterium]
MDPITHGITGALLGKAYFSSAARKRGRSKQRPYDEGQEEDAEGTVAPATTKTRVAIFAATLGAVFPDVDVVREAISRDPLAIVKYHRGITHSFFGLPFFAVGLAALTRWVTRRSKIPAPSFAMLTLIYGVGILSHILLDGMTSFGTMMWTPFSERRVAWDWLFIIDFSLTSIGLMPQITAWIYRDRTKGLRRAIVMWALFTLAAAEAWQAARAVGSPFHVWVGAAASAIAAILFFGPAIRDWGFGVSRAAWCQAGALVMVAYIGACGVAHHEALKRVEEFAAANHIQVVRIGALPVPPSLLDWGDAIRTTGGVYASRYDLRDSSPPPFRFTPDSPPDAFTARALELPEVHLYWNFARFPLVRTFAARDGHMVVFGENRFVERQKGAPQPFTYGVVFDDAGHVVEEGWLRNGMLFSNMQKVVPREGDAVR